MFMLLFRLKLISSIKTWPVIVINRQGPLSAQVDHIPFNAFAMHNNESGSKLLSKPKQKRKDLN
jgi:hypothetical protein